MSKTKLFFINLLYVSIFLLYYSWHEVFNAAGNRRHDLVSFMIEAGQNLKNNSFTIVETFSSILERKIIVILSA